jgi:hypothetical protein
MRILLDHNTPAPLRYALRGHRVETAYERGWAELLNGDLIAEAESVNSIQPSACVEFKIPLTK